MLTPDQIKNALDEKSAQPPDVTLLDIQKALMAENDALRASQVDAHHAHQIQALEVAQLRAENKRLREAIKQAHNLAIKCEADLQLGIILESALQQEGG